MPPGSVTSFCVGVHRPGYSPPLLRRHRRDGRRIDARSLDKPSCATPNAISPLAPRPPPSEIGPGIEWGQRWKLKTLGSRCSEGIYGTSLHEFAEAQGSGDAVSIHTSGRLRALRLRTAT